MMLMGLCLLLLLLLQDVSKPATGTAGYSRVAPLDDELVDPWADGRKNLAAGTADVSARGVLCTDVQSN
jgi:hypothetical protein